ncbi:YrdB family protein [Ectobacillus panaciterrae]|uniref:YrdB family protein n=1 Tax=Ectobacillus panaciterrae TaxID=363872 RepID=UPI0004185292|nr:YrdB family protein [Ectobacillus panaciterrae]
MIGIQYANLALRFLLELCALAALGYWGFQVKGGIIIKTVAGIGAPLLAAVIWGMFVAPRASMQLSGWMHFIVELLVFGSAAVALYAAGRHGLAGAFMLAAAANRILIYIWGQ